MRNELFCIIVNYALFKFGKDDGRDWQGEYTMKKECGK